MTQFQQHRHYEHVRILLFRKNSKKLFLKDLTNIYKSYKRDSYELVTFFLRMLLDHHQLNQSSKLTMMN
jgi:hypothetical protein